MTRENISSYTMQISQANASQLTCIAYELWQTFMAEAMSAYESGDLPGFSQQLRKVQRVNQEIISMMNHENACAQDVMAIHFFINTRLVKSMLKQQPVDLDRVCEMVKKLQASFIELSKADQDAPLMQNTQRVYAGLTYGKDSLNESADPLGQAGRGFLV
ncbi:MAG: flagellar protein FliS [Lachnospiraceae bacterium]|nr:flagellar protein FliS [Lachnospiraceae bacterium]